MNRRLLALAATLFLSATATLLAAQQSAARGFGPLDPSQPAGITVDQIVH
jgi:hypothetical protein